jgi:anti-sigma regulatory factor (Ser/Thr protein kinase)
VNRDEPVVEDLLPIAHTPRHARNIVTEACLRWDLAHLITPATLIVSELVSNVVVHARTMMTLTVALRSAHLYLAVQDGSSTPPVLNGDTRYSTPGGRGLLLVAAASAAWGYVADEGGKTVWATLAVNDVWVDGGRDGRERR